MEEITLSGIDCTQPTLVNGELIALGDLPNGIALDSSHAYTSQCCLQRQDRKYQSLLIRLGWKEENRIQCAAFKKSLFIGMLNQVVSLQICNHQIFMISNIASSCQESKTSCITS